MTWHATTESLPPEGQMVSTKQFEFSNPVELWREGQAWFAKLNGVKGGVFRFQVNYRPELWREK